MKKIIQICSFLTLALVFSAVSANAQSETKVEASIPFAFSIGDKTLPAGNYDIKVNSSSSGTVNVTFFNEDGESVLIALAVREGEVRESKPELRFDVDGERRVLANISTHTTAYSIPNIGSGKTRGVRVSRISSK
ncbi:MAG: hypothetical protein ACT4O9_11370 [Blastocatellia bacterium]